ncbi:MAG: hypothetical protein Q9O24_02870 [Gammaproteobacteria bacterium]|nr:hypothetical protein [Gammaproteobacteria bacterium]
MAKKMMKNSVSVLSALVLVVASATSMAGGVDVANSDNGRLKLSSKLFLGLAQQRAEKNGVTSKEAIGVSLDRAYFALKYKIDPVWSLGFTSDATVDTNLSSKQTRLYVKKAYLKGKLAREAQLRLGVIATPWVGYEDKLFKHRYVSKSYVDRKKFDSSADAGVALAGKLGAGFLSYDVAMVNGAGYSKISPSQTMDLNMRVGIYPVKGLTLDANYRDGYLGHKKLGVLDAPKQTTLQTLATFGGAAYRIGVGYVNHEKVAGSVTSTDIGVIAWGWLKLNKWGAFARFEQTDTDQSGVSVTEQESRYVVGAEYAYNKQVRFSLAVDHANTDQAGFVTGETETKDRVGLYSVVKF